jgi:hypothetical protein
MACLKIPSKWRSRIRVARQKIARRETVNEGNFIHEMLLERCFILQRILITYIKHAAPTVTLDCTASSLDDTADANYTKSHHVAFVLG